MNSIHLAAADYLVVAGYLALVLWIGLWFRNRMLTTRDYFAGGNDIPWWMAGISHYMSSFSAFSFIAYAQMGYLYGFTAITMFWATVPACIAGALFFARPWRRARVITAVQFVENRYNNFLRQLFAWAGIPMKIFDDALKIFATGLLLSVAIDIPLWSAILLCCVVMVLYTFFGGLWALVITDYIQFLMKGLAMLLLLPLALGAAGGLHKEISNLPAGMMRPLNGPYTWLYFAGFTMMVVINYNGSWSLAQKYYSVPNESQAAKAAWFSALLHFVGAPLMILPAIVARNILPGLVESGRTADTYILLVMRLLPSGMVGIVLAAMFSATMATVSGDFNAIAGVLTQDIYHRLLRPRASESQLVSAGRLFTLILGTLTTLLSLWIAWMHQASLFNMMVTVLGLFLSPTLLPLLIGLTVRRINAHGALCGFLAGLITGSTMLILKAAYPAVVGAFGSTYNYEGLTLVFNTAATLAGLFLGTSLSQRESDEQRRTDKFFALLATPVDISELAGQTSNPAIGMLGTATIGVGLLLFVAGIISTSMMARLLDCLIGIVLALTGFLLNRASSPPAQGE
jgi:SSS family transporter